MERLITNLLIILLCSFHSVIAQNETPEKIFYDTRIINGHSVETSNAGIMKFIISHRFGTLNSGVYELFGLDNSTIRMGLDYGISNGLTIGIGRSSFNKNYDSYIKLRILTQGLKNSPLSITAMSGMAIKTLRNLDTDREDIFTHRLSYNHSVMIARRINDRISLQLSPTLIHRNLVSLNSESNDVFVVHTAARFLASKTISLNMEYSYVLPNQLAAKYNNCLSLGIDIETKGHVFQFQISNSRGMIDQLFMTETTGKWTNGDIHYGFNITRDFKIKGRRY